MTDAKTIPQVGEILAGKYVLKHVLGEGGMGVVLAAEHTRLRQDVAIKFLNPDMLGVDEVVLRFDREARAAATLRSRHVVRVTDVEQTPNGIPYMVMELLHGSDLESERERRERIPFDEVVDYVLQACSALAEAHEAGIVHRDLKPANLFLARQGDDVPLVKVLDFGISKFLQEGDAKLTSAGTIMGTAIYMSPEQIRGDIAIDARADIWSLGVILYELIAGVPPWSGPPTRVAAGIVAETAPPIAGLVSLPPALAALIERMMAKDPAARPQAISDVAAALVPFAPLDSVGAEIAEQMSRRSQRGNMRSSPSLEVATDPSQRELAHAQTARLSPERSTMNATTSSLPLRRPSKMLGVLVGIGMLGAIGVILVAFVLRSPLAPVHTVQPVAESTTAPVASSRTTPPPEAMPSAEPAASTEPPKHVASPAVSTAGGHGGVPPKPVAPTSARPSAAPPVARPTSDAKNPVFL